MKLNPEQSEVFVINSRYIWNETSLEIKRGEEYSFSAQGHWTDLFIKSNADGYVHPYMSIFNKIKRSRNYKWFALMGSVNKTDHYFIGTQNKIVFREDGQLYCFANDVKGFYWNNSGCISLKITRTK